MTRSFKVCRVHFLVIHAATQCIKHVITDHLYKYMYSTYLYMSRNKFKQ